MEIIPVERNEDFKKKLLASGKSIGLTEINGPAHDGHNFIFGEVRKRVDIQVVSFVSWNHYFFRVADFGNRGIDKDAICHSYGYHSYENVIDSITPEYASNIDYIVCSPLTEDIRQQTDEWMQYRSACIKFCTERGLGYLWPQVLIAPIIDIFDGSLDCYIGPKNIIPDLAGRRLFQSHRFWNPQYIWKFLRDDGFQTKSRTSNSPEIGKVTKAILMKILSRSTLNMFEIQGVKDRFHELKNLEILVLSLPQLDRLDQISDNCAIVCVDDCKADYLFIKDGSVIF